MSNNILTLSGELFKQATNEEGGEPDPQLVEVLEQVLERAKTGQITGMCFQYTCPNGFAGHEAVGSFPVMAMIAMTQVSAQRLVNIQLRHEGGNPNAY